MVVWKSYKLEPQYGSYEKRVLSHSDFLQTEITDSLMDELAARMKAQQPGHAITYV